MTRSSPQRAETFTNAVRKRNLKLRRQPSLMPLLPETLNLVIDLPTRWNSKLLMMQRAYNFRDVGNFV